MVIATRPGEGEGNASTIEPAAGGIDADLRALFFLGGMTSLNHIIAPR